MLVFVALHVPTCYKQKTKSMDSIQILTFIWFFTPGNADWGGGSHNVASAPVVEADGPRGHFSQT